MPRLDEDSVRTIFAMREEGKSIREIAGSLKVSQQTVSYHLYPTYRSRSLERASDRNHIADEVEVKNKSDPGDKKRFAFIYFRCPACKSYDINMAILKNNYKCKTCGNAWKG